MALRATARLAVLGIAIAAVSAGAWIGLATPSAEAPVRRDVHTYLHLNCKHHNHGPKWHQDHGRVLGIRPARDDEEDGADLAGRIRDKVLSR